MNTTPSHGSDLSTQETGDNGSTKGLSASRRNFVKGSTLAVGAATMVHSSARAGQDQRELRLALVGCGGRGKGAINDSLSVNENVKIVALADLYMRNCEGTVKALGKKYPNKIDVQKDRMFSGLDGYKRILDDSSIDVVMFATSPGFRPPYVLEAVQAGKHVFAEKPSCVDPAGYKKNLEAHELALKSNTAIVTGTQYRRQENYKEAVAKIHAGEIGDIISATTRYCTGRIWHRNRGQDMSDTEYQLFNWMHHVWLSGDHIAEQAVHNIDAINWIMGGPPESAYGSGGRHQRPDGSELWDSFAIDYMYPGNRLCSFMCRQLGSTDYDNGNWVYGSNGRMFIGAINSPAIMYDKSGEKVWEAKGNIGAAYQQEHKDLIDSIRAGEPIVELKQTAESSLTAAMGRMSAYTGKKVTWDFASKDSQLDLFPADLDWDAARETAPVAVPGETKLV